MSCLKNESGVRCKAARVLAASFSTLAVSKRTRRVWRSPFRPGPVLLALSIGLYVLAAVTSCGRYFTAEIAGYVKDSESKAGVDGAVIRIYLEEPERPDEDGFIVETASVTSGGNRGYYSHTIIWQRMFPAFGAEGDTSSVWLGIAHPDYLDVVKVVRGILSGTLNYVPDVTIDRAGFSVPSVTGRVVDVAGSGLNGVRVVLTLRSTEEEEDYVTVTTEIDGEDGTYRFNNVSWRDDEAAGSGSDTEECEISIVDNKYSSSDVLEVLLSSDDPIEVSEVITAASDEFSVPELRGQVLDVVGTPLNGVRVVLDLDSTEGEDETPDYLVTTRTIDGEQGIYRFADVTWTDAGALGSLTDTETATLRVDDTRYESETVIAITLESGEAYRVAEGLHVTRIPSTSFETRIVGRCLTRTGVPPDIVDRPERGIEVTVTFDDSVGAHTLYAQTDANGEYSFYIRWTDSTPGDFIEADPNDPTIPQGEDGIMVEITFSAPFVLESFAGEAARRVNSWLNPNYVPDAIATLPQ